MSQEFRDMITEHQPEFNQPSYYITTPIYYVNAAPHLGTAYCTLLCDVQARYRRSMGYNVRFLTGMDEHGEKVAQAAQEHGYSPQEWCDAQAPLFKDLWKTLNISYDDFIRTTEPRQYKAVQTLWNRMRESGYLYKGTYDGWYCLPCETYFTPTQLSHAAQEHQSADVHLCPDCQRPLKRVEEESYFFKLSAFQDRLLELYAKHPDFVQPTFRMNEVRSFVEGGLQDLSVSRTSFDWGIPVPFDTKHVTYVWFDALLNYMTSVFYGEDDPIRKNQFAFRWPAQCHVVGKDIIRFHCIIWPAMLMAINEALPEHVFAHGFLTVRNSETGNAEKMSKSRGNAIAPQEVIDLLGIDGYRYYFMCDVIHGEDSAISFDRMKQVYNADLANSWGNLVSRTLSMCAKYFDGQTPAIFDGWHDEHNVLRDIVDDGLFAEYSAAMEQMRYADAKQAVMKLIHAANHYIEDMAPWTLAKTAATNDKDAQQLARIMLNLLESIRIAAHLLAPIMPHTSHEVLCRMGLEPEAEILNSCLSIDLILEKLCAWGGLSAPCAVVCDAPLFPRIDTKN